MQATSELDSSSQDEPRPARAPGSDWRVRGAWTLTGILALLVAGYLGLTVRETHKLATAQSQYGTDYAEAAAAAARVRGLPADAALVQASELQRAGDLSGAADALGRALIAAPNRWDLHSQLAVVLQALRQQPAAQLQMRTALRLNPMLVLPPGFQIDRNR